MEEVGKGTSEKKRFLYDYFSIEEKDLDNLDQRETASLNEIANEIGKWSPDKDRRNIFLVDSYKESKRSAAAAFIARKMSLAGRNLVLVRTAGDLRKKRLKTLYGDTGEAGVIFVNYTGDGSNSGKEIQKILLSLGKRRVRKTPVVLSLPDIYSEFFRDSKNSMKVSYPQNPVSRAFVMLAIAALVLPFYSFPYMQIPIGRGMAVNDAGTVSLFLFAYAMSLIIFSRKVITGKHYGSMFLGVLLFIMPVLLNIFFSSQALIGFNNPFSPAFTIFGGGNLGYAYPALLASLPALLKLASISVFPLGFAQKNRRKLLLFTYMFSALLLYITTLLLPKLPPSIFPIPEVATFQVQLPPLSVYYSSQGYAFLQALAGIPSAAIFFSVYLIISLDLKARFNKPLHEAPDQPAGA